MYSNVKLVTYILYDKKILRFPVLLTNLQHYSSSLACRINIHPFPWKAHEFQDSKKLMETNIFLWDDLQKKHVQEKGQTFSRVGKNNKSPT